MRQSRRSVAWERIRTRFARLRSAAAENVRGRTRPPAPPAQESQITGGPDRSSTADQATADPAAAAEKSEQKAPSKSLTARLVGVSWQRRSDGSSLLWIKGSAWRSHGRAEGSRVTGVSLHAGDQVVHCALQTYRDPGVNDHSRSPDDDRSDAAFVATVDPAALLTDTEPVFQRRWQVRITVADEHGEVRARFRSRDEHGSAGQLHSYDIGSGCLARAEWDARTGLRIIVARRAYVAERVAVDGTELEVDIVARGDRVPAAVTLRRGQQTRPLTMTSAEDGRIRARGSLADLVGPADADQAVEHWYLQVTDVASDTRHVHWQGAVRRGHRIDTTDQRIAVRYSPNGVIRIDVEPCRLVVDDVGVAEVTRPGNDHEVTDHGEVDHGRVDHGGVHGRRHQLIITGQCHGLPQEASRWVLTGGRRDRAAAAVEVSEGRFRAVFALEVVPEWGRTVRPLPSADYRLAVITGTGSDVQQLAGVDPEYAESLVRNLSTPGHRIRICQDAGTLRVTVAPPRRPGELSAYNRRRLEEQHRSGDVRPTDTIFLDAFDGKAANDNTRAIRDELRRRRPDLRPVWTVADLSVEVPEDDDAVIIRSPDWWRMLTSSRLVVTNCWMPQKFIRHDHQRVMQTWHGTPLKLLGFDRIGTKRGEDYRTRTLNEVAQWDFLISQNPHSSTVFRSAYGYQGTMLEIGYPRNDILCQAGDDHRSAVRERLGLAEDELIILYVPTWRENAKGLFAALDFDAVTTALGDHGRLLVRGHANTVRQGSDLSGGRLIDVTTYPEIADLYLVADAMITDYSSTMFDFSITGKPMIFFAPDIADYQGSLRGTYFDLAADAPGPVLSRTEEVIEAITDLDHLRGAYAEKYRAWQRRFNPYDDGHATERAVDALLDGFA